MKSISTDSIEVLLLQGSCDNTAAASGRIQYDTTIWGSYPIYFSRQNSPATYSLWSDIFDTTVSGSLLDGIYIPNETVCTEIELIASNNAATGTSENEGKICGNGQIFWDDNYIQFTIETQRAGGGANSWGCTTFTGSLGASGGSWAIMSGGVNVVFEIRAYRSLITNEKIITRLPLGRISGYDASWKCKMPFYIIKNYLTERE